MNTPDDLRAEGAKSALDRFKQSHHVDHGKWHDGLGYDLDAIREASPEELATIEDLLLECGVRGWRDVEALAVVNSPRAHEALRSAMTSSDCEVAFAVVRHASDLLTEAERVAIVVAGLERADFHSGLVQALAQAEHCHPKPVMDALFHGAAQRDGDIAVHFAAMLMFLHGQAESAFDMEQRPFFLTFKTQDPTERETAFRQLCGKVGVEAEPFLGPR